MSVFDYCAARVAPAGSSLYYALRKVPLARQPALLALLALLRELYEIARECHEPALAERKLAWWQAQLHALPEPGAHPVTQALAAAGVTEAQLQPLLQGVQMDIHYNAYRQASELAPYLYSFGAYPARLMLQLCASEDQPLLELAERAGSMLLEMRLVLSCARAAQQGRCYIPDSVLHTHQLDPEQWALGLDDPRTRTLFAQQHQRLQHDWQTWLSQPAANHPSLRPLRIMGRLLLARFAEHQRDGYALLCRQIHLTPLRKLWLSWRTA